MHQAGHQAANQIKREELTPAKVILDVVSENPERPHIPDQMEPPAVQKHRRKERDHLLHQGELLREAVVRITRRDDSVLHQDSFRLLPERGFIKERQHIQDDEPDRNRGKAAGGNIITQGNHPLFPWIEV